MPVMETKPRLKGAYASAPWTTTQRCAALRTFELCLTILGDFAKVSEKSEIEWHNGGVQTVFVDRRST
jgi:hypothetical protein